MGEIIDENMTLDEPVAAAATPSPLETFCASIIDDIVSGMSFEIASDVCAGVYPIAAIEVEDTVKVCASLLSEMVSKVALDGGAKLADEIALESKYLDAIEQGQPGRHFVLSHMKRLLAKKTFAQRLCATGKAASMLVREAGGSSGYWPMCIADLLRHVPEYATQLDAAGDIFTPLLKWGAETQHGMASKARGASRVALNSLVGQIGFSTALPKMMAADEMVPCVAKGLDDERGSMTPSGTPLASFLFGKLDDAKKVQVYAKFLDKEDNGVGTWDHFGLGKYSIAQLAGGFSLRSCDVPDGIKEAYTLYKTQVGIKLQLAFKNNVEQPDMEYLVAAATYLGLKGESNATDPKVAKLEAASGVLKALAPHLKHERARLDAAWDRDTEESDKTVLLTRRRTLASLFKAWNMLLRPEERIKKQFVKAMPDQMLPPPPAPPPPAARACVTMWVPHPGDSAPLQPPPVLMPPAVSAAVVPFVPPPAAPPPLNEYLSRRVFPRIDCAKCVVARGQDASVREGFATDGGKGRVRNVSLKRACPLAAHAISASGDGVELNGVKLLEQYERDYGVKLTNKKQKFKEFMNDAYGHGKPPSLDPLGKAPHYKVTLYAPPRVDASLTVEGGAVKLNLSSFGYTPTSDQGTKDNYMGFMIV